MTSGTEPLAWPSVPATDAAATGALLLLSATELEVEPLAAGLSPTADNAGLPEAWRVRHGQVAGVPCVHLATGVGKANAAAATALALRALRPGAALLVGVGGAFAGAGLEPGDVALAASETHLDSGVGHGEAWQGLEELGFPTLPAGGARSAPLYNRLPLGDHVARLATALQLPALPFGTAEAVTADAATAARLAERHGVAVESMEGAAVAQVALAFGVPLVELRGVSNLVGERDKRRWRLTEAVARSCAAARRAAELLLEGR
ncbi:MAG: futalosine hydrolase [Deinococcales bacterium]|nr:futalosine hydrolase [Deinococcales bacterium]